MNIKNKKKMTKEQKAIWFEAVRDNDIKTVQRMIKNGADINMQDEYGWTALCLACFWFNIDIAKLLIDHGVDITKKDKDGSIPLDDLKSYKEKHEELMQWLAEHYPEKMLEIMVDDNVQGKGIGL